jgi:hypothetical protein
MQEQEGNAETSKLTSFSRKLDSEDRLKDRMIIKHLRQRKNNFLFDFDETVKVQKQFGVNHE